MWVILIIIFSVCDFLLTLILIFLLILNSKTNLTRNRVCGYSCRNGTVPIPDQKISKPIIFLIYTTSSYLNTVYLIEILNIHFYSVGFFLLFLIIFLSQRRVCKNSVFYVYHILLRTIGQYLVVIYRGWL